MTTAEVASLPAVLDMQAAIALKDMLGEAMCSRSQQVVFSAASVERIGTPCVQVLVAAARGLAAENRTLSLLQPTDAMRVAFSDLGLSAELDQWSQC